MLVVSLAVAVEHVPCNLRVPVPVVVRTLGTLVLLPVTPLTEVGAAIDSSGLGLSRSKVKSIPLWRCIVFRVTNPGYRQGVPKLRHGYSSSKCSSGDTAAYR